MGQFLVLHNDSVVIQNETGYSLNFDAFLYNEKWPNLSLYTLKQFNMSDS